MNILKNENIIIVKEANNPPETENVPKHKPFSRNLYLFFLFFQFFLSLDFGFMKCESFKQTIVIKIVTIIPALLMLAALIYHISVTSLEVLFVIWLLYVYLLYGLMVLCTTFYDKENSFCALLKTLFDIDMKMNIFTKGIEFKIIGFTIIVLLIKMALAYTHCTLIVKDCVQETVISIIIFILSTVVDFPLILYSLSFHIAYLRVKNLKDVVCSCYEPVSVHLIYKSMLDAMEMYKKCFDKMYVLYLFHKVPIALATSLEVIRGIKYDVIKSFDSFFVYTHWVFQYMIIVIVPAVFASRLAREVEKIKIILHEKVLLETAVDSKAVAIKNFILYIEARPMRFYICSVMPLDSSFPFVILNVFITYLIVAVQFSHIY